VAFVPADARFDEKRDYSVTGLSGSHAAGSAQRVDLFIGKDAGTGQKSHSLGVFERKHTASPGNNVKDELSVFPVLELAAAYVKGCVAKRSQQNVAIAKQKLSARIAHGRASVAAASRLMEHEVAMFSVELRHQLDGGISGDYLVGNPGHRGLA
jgi:hypothetical protein